MPNGNDHPETVPSSLDVLGEFKARLDKLEGKMDTVLSDLEYFRTVQGGDFDVAHARHVLNKHFFHDKPDAEVEQSRVAG